MAARKEDLATPIDRKPQTMAEKADRHEVYEKAVQNVKEECAFVSRTYREIRGHKAKILREDFCGTGSASCQWVRQGEEYRATGVDFDPDVLDWGQRNRVSRLSPEEQERVSLIEADVMEGESEPADVVAAFNFSYWIFKTRQQMKSYFERAYSELKDDGLFFLDSFGGYEAFEECKEKTKHDDFTYIWHQAKYYPVTGEMTCHISFKFPDKSKMKKAFTYEWRLWTLPEIRELLEEAGFKKSTVYWEGTDDDGEGNGEFTPEEKGEADAGWIAYIVAEK
jgi:cyclopropane fatty-acyl-phospholipid synthase-like methyltransferase